MSGIYIEDIIKRRHPSEPDAEDKDRVWLNSVEYYWRSTKECIRCGSDLRQTHFGWGTVCFSCEENEPDDPLKELEE